MIATALVASLFVTGCSGGGSSNNSKDSSDSKSEKTSEDSGLENLIKNGDFSKGKEGFSLYTNGGAALMDVNDDGALQVDITGIGGVEHGVQIYCDGFKLFQGGVYRMEFDVTSTFERDFDWRVQINSGDYHAYAMETVTAKDEVTHVSTEFTMEEESDPAPRFCFNLGLIQAMKDAGIKNTDVEKHTMTFDNIALYLIDDSNAVKPEEGPEINPIKLNQVGYRINDTKTAILSDIDETEFSVVNAESGDEVYKSTSTKVEVSDEKYTGETFTLADFSEVKEAGTYKVVTGDGTESYEFTIDDNIYDDAVQAAVKMLYLQRCGCELTEEFAGDFKHPECHTEKATIYGTKKKIDVSGGWHDAGDYGRYVVSGAKAVADLLLTYELFNGTDAVENDNIGIPESGNGIPDILDEAKYELDWLFKMQNKEGGVYHKVTCAVFPETVMPEEETDELIVCKVSKTATGDFAAVMAMASRVFAEVDEMYASKCLEAAMKSYDFLEKKGDEIIGFKNPPGVVTGEYPDGNGNDELFFAAVELYTCTTDPKYAKVIKELCTSDSATAGLGWASMGYYGAFDAAKSEILHANKPKLHKMILEEFYDDANEALERAKTTEYNVSIEDGVYPWGSNMTVLNEGMLISLASIARDYIAETMGDDTSLPECPLDEIQANQMSKYSIDYCLGRNATGYCFVTGFGTLSPEHTHHRPSQALEQTMPGMIVGGVDSNLEDPYAKGVLAELPNAKRYADNEQSFSCNEITVYWNSPLIFMLCNNKLIND
ncbi:MAG: glycoside hydrolase family 9 protein [Lachnospiraceae bacterium]|nr:glycoside hydrolase family 9 protein [Lachnospiraceae bacterium]